MGLEVADSDDVYAVKGACLVGADGLRVVKGVIKPFPAVCAAVEPLRLDVGDTVCREHPGHLELVVALRAPG